MPKSVINWNSHNLNLIKMLNSVFQIGSVLIHCHNIHLHHYEKHEFILIHVKNISSGNNLRQLITIPITKTAYAI